MITFAACTRRAHLRAACAGLMMWVALSGCSEVRDDADGSTPPEAGSADAVAEADVGNAEADVGNTDTPVDAVETDSRGSDTRSDTRPEGGGEMSDGGDCSQDPIWTAASLSFTFTSSGGFVAPPPPDAGCRSINIRYDFVTTDRTLVQRGCMYTGPVSRVVYLTPAQYDAILANLSSISTTCTKGCGADYPDVVLTVSASGVQTKYNSNFYAGCAGSALLPPFIAYSTLGALHTLLNTTVNAACNPDAGTSDAEANDSGDGNAGPCVALPNDDSGAADAAEGG